MNKIKIENNMLYVANDWIMWYDFVYLNLKGVDWKIRELLYTSLSVLLMFLNHCGICTRLSGCYFVNKKSPEKPQHPRCHCKKIKIDNPRNSVVAEMNINKLTLYLFSNKSGGKKSIFESWGYSIQNVKELKKEFEEQAKNKYTNGNYTLSHLDAFGQRINITINLKGNSFKSSWMVEPCGLIRNITPFGGWN